ncbi:ferredoxin [Marispirochaeta sp.]|jgi:ferredoxin|uniref:ferredoxin n=1 Tax=Marispirochaeta sp. TaxID=2038653 RepID=UPI0037492BE6
MRVTINKQQCVGCGLCEELLPEVFIMQNQKSRVKQDGLNNIEKIHVLTVAEDCPAEAIIVSESADDESY